MKAFMSPASLPLVPHPCTLPFLSHLWKQLRFREPRLWWGLQWLQESGNNLTLEGAEFKACAGGVVFGNLGRAGTVCWRRAAEVGVWGCCAGGVSARTWINPAASWLIPDHGPSFNTAGDHCTCKFPPNLPWHSLLHLLWLSSSWGQIRSRPEEMWYFKMCSMPVWQETQTLCSFRLWLSRPRDNPGLDLNMARQDWKEIGGDVATESLEQLELPAASSHLGLFDQEWVNGRRTCSLRRTQGSEQLWRKGSPWQGCKSVILFAYTDSHPRVTNAWWARVCVL